MHKYYIWDNKADYTIYSNDNNCKGEVLLTKHISFPYYNQYSVLPECQKYASSELCSIWYDTSNYSELEFIDALTKVGNTSKELFKAEDNDLKTTVLDVIMDNLVYVVLSAIGIFDPYYIYSFKGGAQMKRKKIFLLLTVFLAINFVMFFGYE